MRQPCFLKIWRDCAADTAWYEFSDGSIYEYTDPGSAALAYTISQSDPHGTDYNVTARIPPPGPGYTKLGAEPSAELIYSYPPYDNTDPGPCPLCAGHNTDITALTWTGSINSGGSFTISGSGKVFDFTGTSTAGPIFIATSSDWCVETATVVTVTLENSLSGEHADWTVTNSNGDFVVTVALFPGQNFVHNVTWQPGDGEFEVTVQSTVPGTVAGTFIISGI